MTHLATLHWIEMVGWMASILTIATYSVSTMMPLRILAIAASFCFVTYAFVLELWPLLVMEFILLPINLYRLWQVLVLRKKLRGSDGGALPDFSIVKAYGKKQTIPAGATVFGRGEPASMLYYIARGRVQVAELGTELGAGQVFGEIAFFTADAARTATARCLEETVVYSITEKQFMRLQFEDPSFGLAILRTITQRLVQSPHVRITPHPVPLRLAAGFG